MRPPVILALAALLAVLAMLWLQPSDDPEPDSIPSAHPPSVTTWQVLQDYRVGHDWVEPPPQAEGKHPILSDGWKDQQAFQCTRPECRNCQWMRLFGGEW